MLLPAEATRDHQVDHQEQVVLELEDQAFARTSQAQDALVFGCFERWIGGAQDERAGEPNALERLAYDVALEKIQVDRQVRKLGHAAPMISRKRGSAVAIRPTCPASAPGGLRR